MSLEKIQEVEEIVVLMMDSTIESLKRDLSTIHAGRVSPSMLDNVKIDYYGTPTQYLRWQIFPHLNHNC